MAQSGQTHGDFSVLASFGLGFATMYGLFLVLATERADLGIFVASLAIYHLLEYLYVWKFHPEDCSFKSFLFTPHEYYPFAILFAFFEYFFELAFFPSLKGNTFFIFLGSIGLIVGQFFRTSAMWTAGYNFHHLVRDQRDNKHSLTTNGVYSIFRHPSYFGWFYWNLSSMFIIMNPICMIAFPYVLWNFFNPRIKAEEKNLIKFFGNDYIEYKKKVATCGIPFIKNTPPEELEKYHED